VQSRRVRNRGPVQVLADGGILHGERVRWPLTRDVRCSLRGVRDERSELRDESRGLAVRAGEARDSVEASPSQYDSPVLQIERLPNTFVGTRALNNVSIDVAAGEIHALAGANGSGKSTLIKTLAGFHRPDPGAEMWLNGGAVQPGGWWQRSLANRSSGSRAGP
jgi:ABC-type glutathione transport system ATPase component